MQIHGDNHMVLNIVYLYIYICCNETTLTGESRFHISTPLGIEPWPLLMGSTGLIHCTSETVCECSEIAGSPQGSPSSRLYRLWSWKEYLHWAWNPDRRAVWDQVGLSHCQHDGLVTVWDEAHLRQGHNDQSRQGHQYSETMLTGESRFHISTPLGLEPRPSWQEAKGWPTGPVRLCMNAVRLQALHNA